MTQREAVDLATLGRVHAEEVVWNLREKFAGEPSNEKQWSCLEGERQARSARRLAKGGLLVAHPDDEYRFRMAPLGRKLAEGLAATVRAMR